MSKPIKAGKQFMSDGKYVTDGRWIMKRKNALKYVRMSKELQKKIENMESFLVSDSMKEVPDLRKIWKCGAKKWNDGRIVTVTNVSVSDYNSFATLVIIDGENKSIAFLSPEFAELLWEVKWTLIATDKKPDLSPMTMFAGQKKVGVLMPFRVNADRKDGLRQLKEVLTASGNE